jgi:hypothetical protein
LNLDVCTFQSSDLGYFSLSSGLNSSQVNPYAAPPEVYPAIKEKYSLLSIGSEISSGYIGLNFFFGPLFFHSFLNYDDYFLAKFKLIYLMC